ncbi:MAG: leucine-rich repeat domain-containing protein [Clostridia bacterium]|nr:leucine-rich repeat domain-containing protein [Clostridia bacterium]
MARSALRFRKSDDGWIVAGVTDALEGDEVAIPSEHGDMPVVGIGKNAFTKAKDLRCVTVPSSIRFMEEDAFSGCDYIERVETPGLDAWLAIDFANRYANPLGHNTLTHVYASLYVEGKQVTDLDIPEGTEEIKKFAFCGITFLKSVHIPSSVVKIGEDAFRGCTVFDNLFVDDISAWLEIDFQGNYSNPVFCARKMFVSGKPLYDLVIPEGVTEVKAYAFAFYDELTSVTIPAGMKTIGKMAFCGCEKLVEVRNLSSMNIEKVRNYENGGIGGSLRAVISEGEESGLSVTEDGYVVYVNGDKRMCLGYRGDRTELVLPTIDGLTEIADHAFRYLDKVTRVVIPEGVTYIGSEAFYGCSSLESVSFPDSLEYIDEAAFASCDSLKSVCIPDNVDNLGCRVFHGCSSLESVTLPENLDEIFDDMFAHCESLKFIMIPDSVYTICAETFYGCKNLEYIVIPKYLDKIEHFAFYGCDRLKAIFYKGGKRGMYQIGIGARGNDPFFDAPAYYYSEKLPKKEGNFWHYDEDGDVEIW